MEKHKIVLCRALAPPEMAMLRARDDGSLRCEIIAVSEQVKSDLIIWAAQWRRTV